MCPALFLLVLILSLACCCLVGGAQKAEEEAGVHSQKARPHWTDPFFSLRTTHPPLSPSNVKPTLSFWGPKKGDQTPVPTKAPIAPRGFSIAEGVERSLKGAASKGPSSSPAPKGSKTPAPSFSGSPKGSKNPKNQKSRPSFEPTATPSSKPSSQPSSQPSDPTLISVIIARALAKGGVHGGGNGQGAKSPPSSFTPSSRQRGRASSKGAPSSNRIGKPPGHLRGGGL